MFLCKLKMLNYERIEVSEKKKKKMLIRQANQKCVIFVTIDIF